MLTITDTAKDSLIKLRESSEGRHLTADINKMLIVIAGGSPRGRTRGEGRVG